MDRPLWMRRGGLPAIGLRRVPRSLITVVLLCAMLLLASPSRNARMKRGGAGPPRNARRGRVLPSQTGKVSTMSSTAEKSDPALWERIKHEVTEGGRGGKPGQWSARKAQLAVHDYKAAGGGYTGEKVEDNHLHQWTEEHWGTQSGGKSGETGERYLPEHARQQLTDREYAETTAKKRADTRRGKQFSAQPRAVAEKVAHDRHAQADAGLATLTRRDLLARAAEKRIAGRSRMRKDELIRALTR